MNHRLDRILSLITDGTGVADIGTDHGYIPVNLALNGYSGKIIASDINAAPLNKAYNYAVSNSCESLIDFRLCDGLSSIDSSEIDTVVIAGMGADLICEILDSADWICSSDYKLILQPMSKTHVLRYWFLNNGFSIIHENFVKQNGRVFNIIEARFTDTYPAYSYKDIYLGDLSKVPEQDILYYNENRLRVLNELSDMLEALRATDNSVKCNYYINLINRLKLEE